MNIFDEYDAKMQGLGKQFDALNAQLQQKDAMINSLTEELKNTKIQLSATKKEK